MKIFRKVIQWFKSQSLINVLFYTLIFILLVFLLFIIYSLLFPLATMNSATEIPSEKSSPKDYVVALGFLAAALTLVYNIRRHLSEDYFKEAREQLQKAYNTLNVYDENGRLSNENLRWITTARLLSTAERIGKKIIISSHKEIHIEDRQYWRMQFHEIVNNFPEDFYTEDAEDMVWHSPKKRTPINMSALVIIHRFIEWDDSYEDPIKTEIFSEDELKKLSRSYSNLGKVILAVRRVREELFSNGIANKL